MAITESNTTKTLADGAEPATSKTLVAGSVEFCGPVQDENVRVSATNNSHCSNGDNAILNARQVVEIDEENGVENIGSNSTLNGDCSDAKVVYNGNNTSLAVEVSASFTSAKESQKIYRFEDSKLTEINGSIPNVGENCSVTEEKGHKAEINTTDKGNEMGGQDRQYVVGDFVWGKIRNLFRNYSWWPGRIYDPSDASDYAAKYTREDRSLLVAYFGDGSFSWCHSSQLKPFAENFEEMSKQSSSKSFVNAVQEALDEISWLVGSKMACSCVPEEHRTRVGTRAVNAGIKPGVLVPEGGIGKELIEVLHEPAELLTSVRNVAQLASTDSLLKVTLMKSWLSAFYRTKGRYTLPIYHEAKHIEGLEHKNKSGVKAKSDGFKPMQVWIEVPIQVEGHSSPTNTENGNVKCEKANNGTLLRAPKRKQVSSAENDNGEGKEETGKSSSSRKIKRSWYLSPPYTQFPEELDIEDDTIEKIENISRNSMKLYPNSKLFDDEGSQLGYVRWKLKRMLSMIEDDGGAGISAETKSELEGEMKGLLEMVRRMIDGV